MWSDTCLNIFAQFYNSTSALFGGYGLEYINGSIRPIQVVLTQYQQAKLNASDRSFILNGVLNTSKLVHSGRILQARGIARHRFDLMQYILVGAGAQG